jgi:hypothetical protein
MGCDSCLHPENSKTNLKTASGGLKASGRAQGRQYPLMIMDFFQKTSRQVGVYTVGAAFVNKSCPRAPFKKLYGGQRAERRAR